MLYCLCRLLHLFYVPVFFFFFFQAEDGIRDKLVTGVQTCALPICLLVATVAGELSADARVALEHAAPNLAIACERESAHQHTRRLAVEVRHAAQRLESQNAELEDQHRELSRLNAELDQAGKLKDQFLANVSHELRTPLNSVIGFSDLLLTMATPENPLTETQRDYLKTIARNTRHPLQ